MGTNFLEYVSSKFSPFIIQCPLSKKATFVTSLSFQTHSNQFFTVDNILLIIKRHLHHFRSLPDVFEVQNKRGLEIGYFSLPKTVLRHSPFLKSSLTRILALTWELKLNRISYKNDLNAF